MSYAVYVGKNLTANGRSYLAGYGDEPSSHWLELVPRQQHPANATLTVGITPQAAMPGQLMAIPQVAETARHLRVSYSYYRGVPAPLTNGGLNEYGVAVRDVWSPSRPELVQMTPADQRGPNYSDLARIVIERARNAREGVEIIGDLIARYGYSTYGGNSHFIADADEGWVVLEFAGGQGLWAAQRVGADDIRVSRPGYIGTIPADFANDRNVLAAPHLVSFAVAQGWCAPDETGLFDVNKVYGDGNGRSAGVRLIEDELAHRAASAKITLEEMIWAVRHPQLTGDTAGYGQIVPLLPDTYPELRCLWHTQSGSVAAPFVPVFLGSTDLPPEFKQHRYLTFDESRRFVDGRKGADNLSQVPQTIEATRSAFRAVKRLLYWVLAHHEELLGEITAVFQAHEARLIAEYDEVVATAATLLHANQPELARRYLTYYSQTELLNGLRLVETLTDYVETRSRLQHGLRETTGSRGPQQVW